MQARAYKWIPCMMYISKVLEYADANIDVLVDLSCAHVALWVAQYSYKGLE